MLQPQVVNLLLVQNLEPVTLVLQSRVKRLLRPVGPLLDLHGLNLGHRLAPARDALMQIGDHVRQLRNLTLHLFHALVSVRGMRKPSAATGEPRNPVSLLVLRTHQIAVHKAFGLAARVDQLVLSGLIL